MKTNGWTCRLPSFKPSVLFNRLREGYWLEVADFNSDGKPDLVGCGLGLGELYWYNNPDWERHLMVNKIKMPVGLDVADITGNGISDVIVCYGLYGEKGTIIDPDPDGGKIDWIENPGNPANLDTRWQRHYVGRTVGMHRLRAGHFTQQKKWEIVGMPVVASENVHAVLPVMLYTQPDDLYKAAEWPESIINYNNFRFVHGLEKKAGLIKGSNLDSLILSGEDGVTWLYFDEKNAAWKSVHIGDGEQGYFNISGFIGSGDSDVGRIGDDQFAYVASVEPFHGNALAVYCKDSDAPPDQAVWTRHVLDVFGDPNENGEGVGHQVICADFDQDGDDEFLVALRGPYPWQGVFYYKVIDARKGIFAKWRVSSESAARIAVADFNGNGTLDFATIGYSVEHYYQTTEPKLMLFENEMFT